MARPRPDPETNPPATLTPSPTTAFKRDLKRLQKRGKDPAKLRTIIESLCSRRALDARHVDHNLGGDWKGWRDRHVDPDWVLIYKVEGDELRLGRTGTHADLFE
ncbi:MAG TPA: type II toxin-antitoxin system YafQ family toxin [Isosphaeraceae bacterium]|nr:type II toxin-antitoxin system YafQ family toxin [Isosphaeraceae bacterium]